MRRRMIRMVERIDRPTDPTETYFAAQAEIIGLARAISKSRPSKTLMAELRDALVRFDVAEQLYYRYLQPPEPTHKKRGTGA